MSILVATASRHGATHEIGQAIGRTLEGRGLQTHVLPVDDVGELTDYDAAVIGSAVYLGHWLESARSFVEHHGGELAGRPTWLFSSGPMGDPPRPGAHEAVQVDDLVEASSARGHQLFAGRLDRHHLGFGERAVVFAFRAEDGDFRDWDDIAVWASGIADALKP